MHIPESSDSTGKIVGIAEDYDGNLKLGQTVYFGSEYLTLDIKGQKLEVMNHENILAVINEEKAG